MMESDHQLLAFTLDDLHYGLPLASVSRVVRSVRITPLPTAPEVILGIINVHGTIVAVADLRRRLRMPSRPLSVHDQIVIARTKRRALAIVATSVRGVIELAPHDLVATEHTVPGLEFVQGIAKLSDGLLLVHDLDRLLLLDEDTALERALEHA